jgi:DNA (cytosine-5)-methyltransferase 1
MRYLSVCSGIEACSVAWEPLGWQAAGYSEIEPFPRAVLEQRLGAVPVDWDHRHAPGSNITPLFGDFTKIEAHHVGPIDLLVGGTPCQSFSIAGKRLGLDDARGNLAIEFLALARRLGARWLVWENVPGVRSSWSGQPPDDTVSQWDETSDFAAFLSLFYECGYRGGWRSLDAQYFRVAGHEHAVPQRRERVFVVGYLGDFARAGAVLFDAESLSGHPAPCRKAGESIAPTIASRASGGGGLGTDFDCDGGLIAAEVAPTLNAHFGDKMGLENQHIDGGGDCSLPPVSLCLTARTQMRSDAETETLIPITGAVFDVAHTLSADGFDASDDGTGRGTPLVAEAIAIQERAISENAAAGPQGKGWQEDTAFTLEARTAVQAIAFPERLSATAVAATFNVAPALGAINPMAVCFHSDILSWSGTASAGIKPPGAGITDNIAFSLTTRQPHTVGFSCKDHGQDAGVVAPPLRGMGYDASHMNGGGQVAVAFAQNTRDEVRLFAGDGSIVGALASDAGAKQQCYVAHPDPATWVVRRLTPRECERLQGFPDDWTLIDWRKRPAADTPRYKAIGNSMAVNVMRWIGERIDMVERVAPAGAAA